MILELGKFKILCINIFIILLKAATLNPYKLEAQVHEVQYHLQNGCDICHQVLVMLISLYLITKFICGYVTLAGNIIAMFPILAEGLPNLLLPAIFAQSIDHIALNVCEMLLGYITLRIVSTDASFMSVFVIFLANKFFKIIFAITALNVYSDYYQQLQFNSLNIAYSPSIESHEEFIRKESLE